MADTADFNVSDLSISRGFLNVQDQAVVSIGNLYVGKGGTSVGVVNQTFGTVANVGGGSDWRIGGGGSAADSGASDVRNIIL